MNNELELSPCPFCGGAMQFRKALWSSDGCVDAVIHLGVHPETCGLQFFSTDTTDESVIAAWNTRATLSSIQLEDVVEALKPLAIAHDAAVNVFQNFICNGETSAERRFSDRERHVTAEEAAYEELAKISLDDLAKARTIHDHLTGAPTNG
jgi:hypothetical protein